MRKGLDQWYERDDVCSAPTPTPEPLWDAEFDTALTNGDFMLLTKAYNHTLDVSLVKPMISSKNVVGDIFRVVDIHSVMIGGMQGSASNHWES